MNIVYGICVYYGYFREKNIHRHIQVYNQLIATYPSYTFKFIINLMIDEKDLTIRSTIAENIKERLPGHLTILTNYNYGGTIAGLYDTYEYLKENMMYDWYIMYFEEDFTATNIKFLEMSIPLLEDVIYVGETTYSTNSIKQDMYKGEQKHWTDGGYYFSSYKKFNTIYSTIGTFHKGDTTTKYDHFLDGIILGEMGFPSMLYDAGFKFIGLPRGTYFVHNEP